MTTPPELIRIPARLLGILGPAAPGTRMHRRGRSRVDFGRWFEAVCEVCGPEGSMSPGAVAQYAQVSRTAVHKRMREGKLTAFLFHVSPDGGDALGGKAASAGGRPYTFIPVQECRAWAKLLRARRGLEAPPAPARRGKPHADLDSWRQW